MALEVYEFSVTTPAGTAQAAPLATSLTIPPRVLRRLEFKVPPGPRGQLGFAFGMNGRHLYPLGPGAWVITDDEESGWDLTGANDSGAWECYSYNAGLFDHTIRVRLQVDLPPDPVAATPVLLPPSALTF